MAPMKAAVRDSSSKLNVTLADRQEGRARAARPRATPRIKTSNLAMEDLRRLIFDAFPIDPGAMESDQGPDRACPGGRSTGRTGPCELSLQSNRSRSWPHPAPT